MKLNSEVEEFKRGELPERYMVKLLYGWNNKKFDEEYLKKLERNWNRWKNERKEGEKKYMKKLEESLGWNEKDEQISKIIRGTKKKFLWKRNPKRGVLLWDALDINNFYFILFYFYMDFVFLLDDEEACDMEVT